MEKLGDVFELLNMVKNITFTQLEVEEYYKLGDLVHSDEGLNVANQEPFQRINQDGC